MVDFEEVKEYSEDEEIGVEEEKLDRGQEALKGIFEELERIDACAKEGYVNEKYNYSYSEYKRGLKSCSDLIVGHYARDDEELKAKYMVIRRKFCVNAAAACIKIGNYQQGLEACTLVLEEGPDNETQRRKALFRAGVCARGFGELDEATQHFNKLLEVPDLDEATKRDIAKQMKIVKEEKKRYKQFAKNIVSKKNQDSIIEPVKPVPTQEELEEMAENEAKREQYLEQKRVMAESNDRGVAPTKEPEIMIDEHACIDALNVLIERYGDEKVQEDLKQAAYDHSLKFGQGFILKSRMILMPLQRDLLLELGFLKSSDVDEGEKTKEDVNKAHIAALVKFQHTVRYLARTNKDISDKALSCQKLALGLLFDDSMAVGSYMGA